MGAGNGVAYKHLGGLPANEAGTFEVAYNEFYGANGIGIGVSAPNSHIHHNLLVDAGEIRVGDQGGTHQLANIVIENNTLLTYRDREGSAALNYISTEVEGYPRGEVLFANNFVVDERRYDHNDKHTLIVSQYGDDKDYVATIDAGLLNVRDNVYKTVDAPRFNVFGAFNPGKELGKVYDLQSWTDQPFVEGDVRTTQAIDAFFTNDDVNVKQAGWNPKLVQTPSCAREGVFQIPGVLGNVRQLSSAILTRWAEYNNELGFAYVDDAAGTVNGLHPEDPNWLRALLDRGHTVQFESGSGTGDISHSTVESGRYVVFYIVQDATLQQWQSSNPDNVLDRRANVFTSITNANPDRFDHVHEIVQGEKWQMAWEDLDQGGDLSFMDVVTSIRFGTETPITTAPPGLPPICFNDPCENTSPGTTENDNLPPSSPEDPTLDIDEPTLDTDEPTLDTDEPTLDTDEPTLDTDEPTLDTDEPTLDTNEPTLDTDEPTLDTNEPTLDTNEPTLDTNEPTLDTNEPTLDTNDPTLDTNDPARYQ